jgi:hypothetical protein
LISVILPIFNGDRTVETAIQSLLKQTSSRWELIVVDDGSTDKSKQKVKSFQDPRICYFYQDHQERSVARNKGIEKATGDLLLFLDADDYLFPNAIELHEEYASRFPLTQVFVGDGLLCKNNLTPIIRFSELIDFSVSDRNAFELLFIDRRIVGQNRTTVRHSLVREHGIQFNSTLKYAEDWLFWLEVLRCGKPFFFPNLVAAYRWYPDSTTHRSDPHFRHEQLALVRCQALDWPEFSLLPLAIQTHFFYQLLIEDLGGNGDQQTCVVHSEAFLNLPDQEKARILRLIATDHLVRGSTKSQVIPWIEQARYLYPKDLKVRLFSMLLRRSPRVARELIKFRRIRQKRSDQTTPKPA